MVTLSCRDQPEQRCHQQRQRSYPAQCRQQPEPERGEDRQLPACRMDTNNHQSQDVGTQVRSNSALTLNAGQDINAKAATVALRKDLTCWPAATSTSWRAGLPRTWMRHPSIPTKASCRRGQSPRPISCTAPPQWVRPGRQHRQRAGWLRRDHQRLRYYRRQGPVD